MGGQWNAEITLSGASNGTSPSGVAWSFAETATIRVRFDVLVDGQVDTPDRISRTGVATLSVSTYFVRSVNGTVTRHDAGAGSLTLASEDQGVVLVMERTAEGCTYVFSSLQLVGGIRNVLDDYEYPFWTFGPVGRHELSGGHVYFGSGAAIIIGGSLPPGAPDLLQPIVEGGGPVLTSAGDIPIPWQVAWRVGGPDVENDSRVLRTQYSSPAPDASDRQFVAGRERPVSAACTFASEGPIAFEIPITRHVGELKEDGTLRHADELIHAGFLSPTLTLLVPVYDVDGGPTGSPGRSPEVDRVLFNGEEIGTLTGANDAWTVNRFEVDIRRVRFPSLPDVGGGPPTAAINTIEVRVDTANPGTDTWCTAVAWGSASFKAMSPIVLVHGNGAAEGNRGYGRQFINAGFTKDLDEQHLLYDTSVALQTGTIEGGGAQLASQIPGVATRFGVDSVHIVAHSKGGLDARAFLAGHRTDTAVLSLTTLGAPHDGTVGATLLASYRALAMTVGVDGETLDRIGLNKGLQYVTPGAAAQFNASNLPRLSGALTRFFTVAADADQNGNALLELASEWESLRDEVRLSFAASLLYQLLPFVELSRQCGASLASCSAALEAEACLMDVASPSAFPPPRPCPSDFVPNDATVSVASSLGMGGFHALAHAQRLLNGPRGRNHASLLEPGVASGIVPWLLTTETEIGDLR